MCFSATASFTAGGLLLVAGVAAQKLARAPAERFYAAIPLLFAIQQLTEGVVWISFGEATSGINGWATQLYSFFSHVLWPVYVPVAAWLLETDPPRRRLLAAVCAAGLAIGAYLLYSMVAYPIVARPTGGHVEYDSPHFYVALSMTLYLLATTVSLLLSTHPRVRFFGALALGSAVVAYALFARWFISVWCFFAAVLSISVLLQLMPRRSAAGVFRVP
ncbi:DUF6629 family protein [Ramlibacter sp. AN1015]|uniref:DUF6629 family protein n=1 Tax=Ramlibacter sp. AN1015 TaxID=3133428 RepID=UPI0030C29623